MSLNREAMLRYEPPDEIASYKTHDTILYALSIGLGADPTDLRQLSFVYENGLSAFPTMAFVIGWSSVLGNPEFGVERGKQVVSGLGLELHDTLPAEGQLVARTRILSVSDAGKGALIRVRRTLAAESGSLIATVDTDVFVRGAGGLSNSSQVRERPPEMPDTPPDAVCDLPTASNMALMYRLNGDRNPLHASPDFARKVGFERPILHGQASFAVAVHALLRFQADYDVRRIQSVRARLIQPFYPGQTLRTKCWALDETILFRCLAVESDTVVIDNGIAVIAA